MQLVIGNRNYSSWSLRAWLAMRFAGLEAEVIRIPLDTPEFGAQVRRYSRAARVPVLLDDGLTIWDSLAICEHFAERSGVGWPDAPALRAHARSAVAEMHAGFGALREALPMNIRARRRIAIDAAVEAEIERIVELWCEALTMHDGSAPGLHGPFGISDAFFAPVALRFRTYGVAVPELCGVWMQALFADPHLRAWCELAEVEVEVLEVEERGEPLSS